MTYCWKRMSSGKYIDLANFTSEDVEIADIEVSLNQIVRFTGHYSDVPPLTVAEHSLLCLQLAQMLEPDDKELHRWVFMHDFAEAYIGDVATPVKRAMGSHWYNFATPIEQSVERALTGLTMAPDMHDKVKVYDLAALDIERRVIWKSQYGKDKWPTSPLNLGTVEDKETLFKSVVGYLEIAEIWESLNEI